MLTDAQKRDNLKCALYHLERVREMTSPRPDSAIDDQLNMLRYDIQEVLDA